jgi:hypothetical protein
MTPFEIAATIGACALAATRMLKAAAPIWSKLPKPLAAFVPVLILALPKIASMTGLVHTDVDLTVFGLEALALVVPGAMAHPDSIPPVPPVAAHKA